MCRTGWTRSRRVLGCFFTIRLWLKFRDGDGILTNTGSFRLENFSTFITGQHTTKPPAPTVSPLFYLFSNIRLTNIPENWSEPLVAEREGRMGHCPPKICLAPKIRSLSESPIQTIDSSPCCKTGPSSGPPNENVWLRPWQGESRTENHWYSSRNA